MTIVYEQNAPGFVTFADHGAIRADTIFSVAIQRGDDRIASGVVVQYGLLGTVNYLVIDCTSDDAAKEMCNQILSRIRTAMMQLRETRRDLAIERERMEVRTDER